MEKKLSYHWLHNCGKGWSKRHLHHCLRIAEVFPNIEIVHALRAQFQEEQKAVSLIRQLTWVQVIT